MNNKIKFIQRWRKPEHEGGLGLKRGKKPFCECT